MSEVSGWYTAAVPGTCCFLHRGVSFSFFCLFFCSRNTLCSAFFVSRLSRASEAAKAAIESPLLDFPVTDAKVKDGDHELKRLLLRSIMQATRSSSRISQRLRRECLYYPLRSRLQSWRCGRVCCRCFSVDVRSCIDLVRRENKHEDVCDPTLRSKGNVGVEACMLEFLWPRSCYSRPVTFASFGGTASTEWCS